MEKHYSFRSPGGESIPPQIRKTRGESLDRVRKDGAPGAGIRGADYYGFSNGKGEIPLLRQLEKVGRSSGGGLPGSCPKTGKAKIIGFGGGRKACSPLVQKTKRGEVNCGSVKREGTEKSSAILHALGRAGGGKQVHLLRETKQQMPRPRDEKFFFWSGRLESGFKKGGPCR